MKQSAFTLKTKNLDLVPADDMKLWTKPWYINKKDGGSNVGRLTFKGKPENCAVELEITIKEDFRFHDYYEEVAEIISNWALGKDNVFFVEVYPYKEDRVTIAALTKSEFKEDEDLGRKVRYVKGRGGMPWILMCVVLFLSGGFAIGFTIHSIVQGLIIGACLGFVMGAFMAYRRRKRMKDAEAEWRESKKKRK